MAAETGFYDFQIGDEVFSIESRLCDMEDAAAPILRRVAAEQSLTSLTEPEFATVARFIAAQIMRTPRLIEQSDRMAEQMRQRLRERGHDPDMVPQLQPLTPDQKRQLSAAWIHDSAAFVPLLLDKLWMLALSEGKPWSYISDNPVVLHNSRKFGPLGNLGLAVPGIEVHLPIAASLSLGLYCRSLFEDMPGAGDGTLQRLSRAACNQGRAVMVQPENVVFLNSLQVAFSSRFVFSRDGDFGLVREMLAEHPRLRIGHGSELA